jgi:hypothetical protein
MGIFYHSQSFEQYVKNGQVGYIGSNSPKVTELKGRLPRRIWVFKTPKGIKGSIRLVGSLLVSDEPKVAVNSEQADIIHYDPFSVESRLFTDSDTAERTDEVNRLLQYRFHAAFKSGFKGEAGWQALESNVVRELETLVTNWATVQMLERVTEGKKVQPINPFSQQPR